MKTKWEILQLRKKELLERVKNIEAHMEWAAKTPFKVSGSDEPGRCSKCKKDLPTEMAFEDHFVVPDERYLDLGVCPKERFLA